MFVDESQQAGQAAYVAVHGAVHCTALTVHIGDDRQTRGASSNDPIQEEVLRRLGQKKVALHGLSDWSVPHDFLVLAAAQIAGERSQESLPAEYLAAAGRGLPTAAATVRSANGLSSEGSPGLNLVLPSSMRVSPTAYFMSVAVWYPHLVRTDDDGRVIIGRCVEQAAEVIATRNAMLNGITTGVSSVEWQPKLLYLQGHDVALGLAAESLQAVEHVVDVLLASFHGSFRRGPDKPKLLLMNPA